jgi:hypothetical protein
MAGIGLSGNDWLGISGALQANRVEGCGTRPIFDQEGKAVFDQCVQNQQRLNNSALEIRQDEASTKKNKVIIYAIVAIVAMVLLYMIFKPKKNG